MDAVGKDGEIAELLDQVKERRRDAFSRLYQLMYRRVALVCQQVLPMQGLAEDALQETFLKVWTHAGMFDRSRGSGRAWIETVARHASIDMLRRGRFDLSSGVLAETWIEQTPEGGPAAALQSEQRRDAVIASMACLGDRERASLRLAFFQELSHEQVAAQMERPLGTVKSWVRRGMRQMRQQLRTAHSTL